MKTPWGTEAGGDLLCIVIGLGAFPFIGWWSVLLGFVAGFALNIWTSKS